MLEQVVLGLLRYWPKVNSTKEVMFLNEVEDIFEVMDPAEFAKVQEPLFNQLAKSVASPHFQVGRTSLYSDAQLIKCNRLRSEHCTSGTMNTSAISSVTTSKSSCQSCFSHYMRTRKVIGIGRSAIDNHHVRADLGRTIHGMVYNAMKLFMEINPQLFDECSEHYREHEATAEKTLRTRTANWALIADWAKQNSKGGNAAIPPLTDLRGQKFNPPSRIDEDPITQDSQKRLDALRLQDESSGSRDGRRQRGMDGHYQVGPQTTSTVRVSTFPLTRVTSLVYGRPCNTDPPTPRAKRVGRSHPPTTNNQTGYAQQCPTRRMRSKEKIRVRQKAIERFVSIEVMSQTWHVQGSVVSLRNNMRVDMAREIEAIRRGGGFPLLLFR